MLKQVKRTDYPAFIKDPLFAAIESAAQAIDNTDMYASRPRDAVEYLSNQVDSWRSLSHVSEYCRIAAVLFDDLSTLADQSELIRRNIGKLRGEIRRNYGSYFLSLAERDGELCRQCGNTHNLCIDHIVPLIKGGTNDIDNLQLLCGDCNLRKSDKI